MRFMVMVKATKSTEAGVMPSEKLIADMTRFNEELVKAGIMKTGDGLKPSKHGARIRFSKDDKRTVIDGPFAETKELVAGFWIWECKSMQEAMSWAKRCPSPMPGEECEIEVRPFIEVEDFGPALTPELREREARLRDAIEK